MRKIKKTTAFGAKTSFDSADLILIPVPWEATASYRTGTGRGPELIKKASSQLDFFSPVFNTTYNQRIHFQQEDSLIVSLNKEAKTWSKNIQKNWTEDKVLNQQEKILSEKVNQASQSLLDWIYEQSQRVFDRGKVPALIGGEHSISEALLRLIGEKLKGDYGLLHIDAHADLRESYQGFKHSHASVMHNVLNLSLPPKKLVQVGVRDFCEKEYKQIKEDSRIKCFFDENIFSRLFSGENWGELCKEIVACLPSQVYVSLDVDALCWSYAPGTGTPVPGGLSYNQLLYLIAEIRKQKKRLLSFDVVETAEGGEKGTALSDWNGNVSARLIYYLSGFVLN